MTMPPMRPARKNPMLRTPLMNLPPAARSRVALGITAAAAEGRFELQVCQDCGAVQYPPREACHCCLSPRLKWREQSGAGRLLAVTTLHHSNDLFFRERLPWRLGLVQLDAGPTLMVHLHGDVQAPAAHDDVRAPAAHDDEHAPAAHDDEHAPAAHGDVHPPAAHGDVQAPAAHGDVHPSAAHDDVHPSAAHGDVHPSAAHGDADYLPPPIRVGARLDRAGQAVLIGFPNQEGTAMSEHLADDKLLLEMTSDPKFRKLLVTDAMTPVGQALVRALIQAGADIVWAGHAQPWKRHGSGIDDIAGLPQVTLVPLDLSNARSVSALAGEIGGKVDIVINNAEVHRAFGIAARRGTDVARAEMDINYFGLLRLAQEFGPALKGRAADGATHASAWVNLLSIYALSNFAPHGTYSASKAAAHSLSQCLRAEMRPAGIRVIHVFPGPIDDEWNQNMPPPKLSPGALAGAIIKALRDGLEDVYPGDVAQEWLARWRDNPKVLERELAAGG